MQFKEKTMQYLNIIYQDDNNICFRKYVLLSENTDGLLNKLTNLSLNEERKEFIMNFVITCGKCSFLKFILAR